VKRKAKKRLMMPGSAAAKLAALELVTIDGVLPDALQE